MNFPKRAYNATTLYYINLLSAKFARSRKFQSIHPSLRISRTRFSHPKPKSPLIYRVLQIATTRAWCTQSRLIFLFFSLSLVNHKWEQNDNYCIGFFNICFCDLLTLHCQNSSLRNFNSFFAQGQLCHIKESLQRCVCRICSHPDFQHSKNIGLICRFKGFSD